MDAIRLYPPHIEGVIPAFYGTTLVVPFSMNRAVSKEEIDGFEVKIKTVSSNIVLGYASSKSYTWSPMQVVFNIDQLKNVLQIGSFYKIQMCYYTCERDNQGKEIEGTRVLGYYSTVATVKYTSQPIVRIDKLESSGSNIHIYDYTGVYEATKDKSEKIYSYSFNLYNKDHKIIKSSGERVHNIFNDEKYGISYDRFNIAEDLKFGENYYLQYTAKTINNLIVFSPLYKVIQKKSVNPEIKVDLVTKLNFENGFIDLKMIGKKDESGVEYASTGTFKILRAEDTDDFTAWNEVLKFALYSQKPSQWVWQDKTVKQGVRYKYGLQQYNSSGLTSNRIESEEIYADFEHAFLYDGKRQLKIKYNPKVSSFKNDLLESKIDTIGGKYPFIFRNGNVKYKEFPISGLISCNTDDGYLFVDKDFLENYDNTINLTSKNIATEREFKLEVLEWLNNGQPKLFRSPSEGNYIVRLLNVSLSPTDSLGRMLHSFSATAYEIADFTYNNLSAYNLLQTEDPSQEQIRWETIELDKDGIGDENKNLLNYSAVAVKFEGMIPGDKIFIDDGNYRVGNSKPGYSVIIGATGSYNIDLSLNTTINGVYFYDSWDNENIAHKIVQHQGSLTYAYKSKTQNRFDTMRDIIISDIPLQQFIGEHNVSAEMNNVKCEIQNYYFINATMRDVYPLYKKIDSETQEVNFYKDKGCTTQTYLYECDNLAVYEISEIITDDVGRSVETPDGYYDPNVDKFYEKFDPSVYFDKKQFYLGEIGGISKMMPPMIQELKCGNGIILEIGYQAQEIEYSIEDKAVSVKYPDLINKRALVDNDYLELKALRIKTQEYYRDNWDEALFQNSEDNYTILLNNYLNNYNEYITLLEECLKKEEESQGDTADK